MIYTVTLNPALDYNMYPENLAVGEINRSSRESLYFGGKGINVSFILNELGIPSVATGFIDLRAARLKAQLPPLQSPIL